MHRLFSTWHARNQVVWQTSKYQTFCISSLWHSVSIARSFRAYLNSKDKEWSEWVLSYLKSFVCLLMSAVWYKVLPAIDICNKAIQARDATLDVEVSNIELSLKIWWSYKAAGKASGMKTMRWHQILRWKSNSHGHWGMGQKTTRMHDDTSTPDTNMAEMTDTDNLPEEAYFRKIVFYVLIDNVVAGLTLRFNAVEWLAENFDFLWKYPTMSESELEKSERVSTPISYWP